MILSALDIPARALQSAAGKAGAYLPHSTIDAVKEFVANRSWFTRSAAKATAAGALAGGAVLAGAGPIGLTAGVIGTCVAGRTFRIDRIKTGQDLPKVPRNALRETAHHIATLAAHSNTPKTIALPFANAPEERVLPPAADLAAQRLETDRCLNTFIQNASIAATIGFVHRSRLGLSIDPVLLPKIVFEASKPGVNLWDVYIKYLGQDFTFFQRIQACFWFFLSYSLGIIPNSIHTFMTNILKEGRNHFDHPTTNHPLDRGIRNILDQLSSLLDVYNRATRNYAETDAPTGDVDSYRRNAIAGFGGKSIQKLTEEFCTTAVDQFMPQIPFFETLKTYPVIGWFFSVLDWFIGGMINCVGRKILKAKLPELVQEFMTNGVDSSNLTNLQFSIAITNAMTALLRDVGKTSIANEAPPFKPAKLPSVIEKLVETLALHGSTKEPLDTQQKLRKKIEELDRDSLLHCVQTKWRSFIREQIRASLVECTHVFFAYMGSNSEKLFGNVLDVLNTAFSETTLQTPEDYDNAFEELEKTARTAFHKLIHTALEGSTFAEKRATYDQIYGKYKDLVDDTVQHLEQHGKQIAQSTNLPERSMEILDEYTQVLKQLTESPLINKARDAGPAVENAFYESFYPFQKELPALTSSLLELQTVLKTRQVDLAKEELLASISKTLQHISDNIEEHLSEENLETLCHQLQKLRPSLPAGRVAHIQRKINILEQSLSEIEKHKNLLFQRQQREALSEEQQYRSVKDRKPTPYRANSTRSLLEEEPLDQDAYKRNLKEARMAFKQLKNEIEKIKHSQVQRSTEHTTDLSAKLTRLQETSAQINQVYRTIQRSHVEKATAFNRMRCKVGAKIGTKYAMDFFGEVYSFLTTSAPYDALRRVTMQTFIDTYPQK